MYLADNMIFEFIVVLIIFMILTFIGVFVHKRIRNSSNRYLNPLEFLPEDEVFTLKQVLYLIMIAACFINVLYNLTCDTNDILYLAIFDLALSVYIAASLDKSSTKNKIMLLLLVPYGSLGFLLFDASDILFLQIIHVVVFLYFIKFYFDKFREYTNSNGLGITIILLFAIVFFSFLLTQITENVNAIDSLVMVSNAFTSNGYAVLGNSIVGKLNSIFLVWGGYIISGAGTATLTAAILLKHFNRRIGELERLIEEGDDENDV